MSDPNLTPILAEFVSAADELAKTVPQANILTAAQIASASALLEPLHEVTRERMVAFGALILLGIAEIDKLKEAANV